MIVQAIIIGCVLAASQGSPAREGKQSIGVEQGMPSSGISGDDDRIVPDRQVKIYASSPIRQEEEEAEGQEVVVRPESSSNYFCNDYDEDEFKLILEDIAKKLKARKSKSCCKCLILPIINCATSGQDAPNNKHWSDDKYLETTTGKSGDQDTPIITVPKVDNGEHQTSTSGSNSVPNETVKSESSNSETVGDSGKKPTSYLPPRDTTSFPGASESEETKQTSIPGKDTTGSSKPSKDHPSRDTASFPGASESEETKQTSIPGEDITGSSKPSKDMLTAPPYNNQSPGTDEAKTVPIPETTDKQVVIPTTSGSSVKPQTSNTGTTSVKGSDGNAKPTATVAIIPDSSIGDLPAKNTAPNPSSSTKETTSSSDNDQHSSGESDNEIKCNCLLPPITTSSDSDYIGAYNYDAYPSGLPDLMKMTSPVWIRNIVSINIPEKDIEPNPSSNTKETTFPPSNNNQDSSDEGDNQIKCNCLLPPITTPDSYYNGGYNYDEYPLKMTTPSIDNIITIHLEDSPAYNNNSKNPGYCDVEVSSRENNFGESHHKEQKIQYR